MKTIATTFGVLALVAAGPALAEGDLSRANVIDVVIEMGSNDDGMYFSPNNYEFLTGQAMQTAAKVGSPPLVKDAGSGPLRL